MPGQWQYETDTVRLSAYGGSMDIIDPTGGVTTYLNPMG